MKTKSKLSYSKLIRAAQADEGIGFCISCGHKQYECEPDARKYTCEKCNQPKVYGAEELLMMVL